MTGVTTPAEPLVVFGDLDGDLWGVIVGGAQPRAAVARLSGADIELAPAELDTGDDDVWLLTAGGLDLRVELADASSGTAEESLLEPCRVSGSAMLEENRREFDIGGMRSSTLAADGGDSLRLFAAWFPGGHEIGLVSARPGGAKGHDRDGIGVVVRGDEHPLVIDPRLSTTYDQTGAPRRVGLELWVGDDEDGELWPRRVAGTATGSSLEDPGISAHAFECVSRGESGAGVYVLLEA